MLLVWHLIIHGWTWGVRSANGPRMWLIRSPPQGTIGQSRETFRILWDVTITSTFVFCSSSQCPVDCLIPRGQEMCRGGCANKCNGWRFIHINDFLMKKWNKLHLLLLEYFKHYWNFLEVAERAVAHGLDLCLNEEVKQEITNSTLFWLFYPFFFFFFTF